MKPETRYVTNGDVHIAYQIVGDGPFDLVFAPGYINHLELAWKLPMFAATYIGQASFSRLIRFNNRGSGMSDPVSGALTLETRMDDMRALMDEVGSRRAAIYGLREGGAMALLFAATYPERTAALALRTCSPRTMWAPDFPWGQTEDQYRRELERSLRIYGSRDEAMEAARGLGPQLSEETLESYIEYLRYGASPGMVEALYRMNKEIDVRDVLPAIRVPTLILHSSEDRLVPIEVGRYMAERIPVARLVEVPGAAHVASGESSTRLVAEQKKFFTEVWEAGGWDEAEPERMLATVLFTDIVDSTSRAIALGDRAWRDLLEQHHALVRRELVRFRGREVDNAGDGFLATFDGPARAIRCARAIVDGARTLSLELRAGLHTGECELVDGKPAGIALHTGSRVASHARAGEVLVSSTVKDLVAGSGIQFDDRGANELEGIPGEWHLFAVDEARP